MLVMRPAREADLPQVRRLAAASPVGVTSLPDNADRLLDKIQASEASFAADVSFNGEESYFFVLEDSVDGRLRGCSSIIASAGFTDPFYSFRNDTFVHASRELKVHNKIHALSLCHDLTGNSLLGSFHVETELVGSPLAELTSRCRLLFMAAHPQRFAEGVVVEIVGICDEHSRSPFWDAVGRNFFDIDYAEAERLSGLKSRTFLAELMPHYPIYVPLLPDTAQEVMGQVHPDARATFEILAREGFEPDNYIDIFDGGPTLNARVSGIRSIARSRLCPVAISATDAAPAGAGRSYLLANEAVDDFRAILVELDWDGEGAAPLTAEQAEALQVAEGDDVRRVPL